MNKDRTVTAPMLALNLLRVLSVFIFLIGTSGDDLGSGLSTQTVIIGALGILLFIILPFAFYLLRNAWVGVTLQLSWAKSSNGFVGVIAFIFAWLLVMPIMIIWALTWGTITHHNLV